MDTGRRIAVILLSTLAALLFLVFVAVVVLTTTDWGREQSRQFALRQLEGSVNGEVEVGRLEGSLLSEIRLIDISIVDTAGRPFVRADTLSTQYSLWGLISKRISLTDIRLSNAEIVLDEPPGEDWNFVRIFMSDEAVERAPSAWGDWIELRDLTLVNSRITVRAEWEPPPDLTPAEEQEAIRQALAGETRDWVVEVPGGFQNLMDFRELDATIPRVLVAHPDTAAIPIDIDQFSGIAQPFSPPAAVVRDLAGRFRLQGDTLYFHDVRARLPESRVSGDGFYGLEHAELVLELEGSPAAFGDFQWLYPPLPEEGGGTLDFGLHLRPLSMRIRTRNMDLRVGESELAGDLDLLLGDTVRVQDTNLRFARFDTRIIDDMVPAFEMPRHGRLTGDLALNGTPSSMRLDGDLTFDDFAGGRSRVIAAGGLSAEENVRFQQLRIQFRPLQAQLVRAFVPNAPIRGTIQGAATLTGRPDGLLQLESDLTLHDPQTGASRVLAAGGLDMRDELRLRDLRLRFSPLRVDLLRDQIPDLPRGGILTGGLRVDGVPSRALQIEGALELNDPASGTSRVAAAGGLTFGETIRFEDMRARLDPLQLDLIRPYAPDLPEGATATGPLRLNGSLGGMLYVDGDLALNDPATGLSRVAASGGIDLGGAMRFQRFDLQFDPLQMSLVRSAAPDLPLGGTLQGSLTLNGAPSAQLDVSGDLVHVDRGERSHISGGGLIATGADPRVDLQVELQPISLQTVGRFAPEAGLRGSAEGAVAMTGPMRNLMIDADLRFQHGGELQAVGRLDLESAQTGYDLRLSFDSLNLAAVTERAPTRTALFGTAQAEGRGFEPATMNAMLDVDLEGSAVDGVAADEVRVRMDIAEGLATFQPSRVRIGTAEARIDGSFGLVEGRYGELAYQIDIDSLSQVAPWVPAADTGVVVARPAARQEVVEEVERAVEDAEVELLATGRPPADPVEIDALALAEIPRDSLAGSLAAQGTLRGNIVRFDADGRAVFDEFLYQGNFVEGGEVEYALIGVGTEEMSASVDASFESLLVEGFAFDAAQLTASYKGGRYGTGEFEIQVQQDEATDMSMDAEFSVLLERNEFRLREMEIRIDTVAWRSSGAAAVNWSGAGVEVQDLELLSDAGGRIFVDGDLPVEGPADLDIAVSDFDIALVFALLQDERDASGRLWLDARVRGSLENPTLEGEASLLSASIDGEPLPDTEVTMAYSNEELRAEGVFRHEQEVIGELDARVPMDLSLSDGSPRLLDRTMHVEFRADRLPLNALPAFAAVVDQAEGGITADLVLTGSPNNPVVEGEVSFNVESLNFAPLGVEFDRIVGHASAHEGILRIDSLVVWSDGPTYINGEVNFTSLTRPELDLEVESRDTKVIDTKDARLNVDADLTISGPIDGLEVAGLVRTRRGVIYVPELSEFGPVEVVDLDDPAIFERVDTLLIQQREDVRARSALLENIRLDLELQIDRDVWLRSTEMNVEIYTPQEVGPLRIMMTGLQDTPTMEGTINADRGEVEYLSRRFVLTRGAVSFVGEEDIDPIIQVAAEHEVRLPGREALTIRIVLGGTLKDLEITLESDAQPPIPETDLLSFLAFGREASSLIHGQSSSLSGRGGAGGLAGNVAGLAMQQFTAVAVDAMVTSLEADIGRQLNLDVIRITPAPVSADVFTGSYLDVLRGTEIEAGRYIAPRLFVAAQARPTRAYPGIRVEYRTRRGFEWTLSWRPRFIPSTPTLRDPEVQQATVLGSFVRREWRF